MDGAFRPGKAAGLKVLLVVQGESPATISVVSPASGVALSYDPATFNTKRISDGQAAVMFEPCGNKGGKETQFNGGFLVSHPLCARLRVTVRDQTVGFANLPLGAEC
jgi:hypothetical protein